MPFHRPVQLVLGLAVLATGAAVSLADDPGSVAVASGTPGVTFYLSPPRVQGPFQAGAIIETFNSMPTGATTSATLAMGTITAGSLTVAAAGQYGGAVTQSATPVPFGTGTGTNYAFPTGPNCGGCSATISLTTPANYLGFYWSAGDASNRVVLSSGGQQVAEFTTADVLTMIPRGGTVTTGAGTAYDATNFYGNPRIGFDQPNEAFAYVHAVADQGTTFDQITLVASGFEFDNLAVYTGTVDPAGIGGLIGIQRFVAVNDTYQVLVGTTLADSVAANDTYGTGTTFSAVTQPGVGSVTMASNGSFTFTAPGSATSTSFTYRLCRPSAGACEQATATINVIGGTVTFDANGGSGTAATQSALPSSALTSNTFTRAGYTFTGWNTTISGTGTSYADGGIFPFTTNITLYAQWTPVPPGPQVGLVTLPVATTTVAPPATTPPGSTSPPSTAPANPTTTVPSPVTDGSGMLPALLPGQSAATNNGVALPVEVFFDDTNTLVMRGQDFELNLAGDCAQGCDLQVDDTGRQVLALRQDGSAQVEGFGFLPGTLVHIWMFSEPTYLGSLLVADDGTFQGSVYLAGIAPGAHTLQVNGTSFDGNDRSANLGVIVTADANPSPLLPVTGSNRSNDLVLVALGLVLAGLLATARRRA